MTAFLLIVIAALSFIISKVLHSKADSYNSVSQVPTKQTQAIRPLQTTTKHITQLSYWEIWKKNHQTEAMVIESNIDREMSILTDNDAKDIIDAFTRMAHANDLKDWTEIKPLMLDRLTEMVDALGKDQAFTLLESAIRQEVYHTHSKTENTSTHIAFTWLKESMEEAQKSNKPFSKAIKSSDNCSFMTTKKDFNKVYSNEEINRIVELFKKEYNSQIMNTIGNNIHIPLFTNGYDSPVAREIMNIMYSYLRNADFIDKAKAEGLWNRLVFAIIEETNKITDKYCDADVQECIEYYNFPEKPVVTSRRCPSCGSREVMCEDIGFYECMECGVTWLAQHGRNTYTTD